MPKGLLIGAFDFSTTHADEFHDWYDLEHIPEQLTKHATKSPAASTN